MLAFLVISLGVLLISSTTPNQINQVINNLTKEE